MREQIMALRILLGVFGFGLIMFSVFFEQLAEKMEWQYQAGMGAGQWGIFILGSVFLITSYIGREKK